MSILTWGLSILSIFLLHALSFLCSPFAFGFSRSTSHPDYSLPSPCGCEHWRASIERSLAHHRSVVLGLGAA